jgi:hypothetical protein
MATALPKAVTQMPDPIGNIMADAQKQTTALQAEQQQKEAAIKQQQAAAEAPLQQQREAAVQDFQQGLKSGPEQVPMPENKAEHIDPKEMSQAAGLMMGLAALAGSMTRAPLTASLKAMTGAMQGLQAGDEQQFQRDYDTYKTEFDKAIGINKARVAEYDKVLKGKEFNLREMDAELTRIAKKYGDEVTANAKTYKDRIEIIRGQEKQGVQAQEHHAKIAQQVEDRAQRLQIARESAAQRAQFHADSMAVQRERLTMAHEKAAATAAKAGGHGGSAGAAPGSVNARMAGRQTEAINAAGIHLQNMMDLPAGASIGTFSDLATHGVTGLGSAWRALGAQKVTAEEDRTFQQFAAGLEQELAVLASSGGGAGAGRMVQELQTIRPKSGDSKTAMLSYLALAKQSLEVAEQGLQVWPAASQEQKDLAKSRIEEIQKVVPWSVSDVAKHVHGKKGGATISGMGASTLGVHLSPVAAPAAPAKTKGGASVSNW